MSDLRSKLIGSLERFTTRLATGDYGDPHVAFVVLVHPDREPAIVAITERGEHDFTRLEFSEGGDEDSRRFFTAVDLKDAKAALNAAEMCLVMRLRNIPLGEQIRAAVHRQWDAIRSWPLRKALENAEYEAAHPFVCDGCKQRFKTERGRQMHLSRARHCKAARAHRGITEADYGAGRRSAPSQSETGDEKP